MTHGPPAQSRNPPPTSATAADEQAQAIYALWMARRVSEPDTLRAQANAVSSAATAGAAGTLVVLIGRISEAGIVVLCLAVLSLVLLVVSVASAFIAMTRQFVTPEGRGVSSSELIQKVKEASRSEATSVRPHLNRAIWFGLLGLGAALTSLLVIETFPATTPDPSVTVQLTPEGQSSIDELCGVSLLEVSGELVTWDETGAEIGDPDAPCQAVRLWLPDTAISGIGDEAGE